MTSQGAVRAASRNDVMALRYSLRTADLVELQAHKISPEEALLNGHKHSLPHAFTVTVDNRPAAMFGVVPVTDSEFGAIWFLGSKLIHKIKLQFLRESRTWLDTLSQDYQLLFNDVHHDNKLHIRWLKWLGFSFLHYEAPFIEFVKIPCGDPVITHV